MRAVESAVILAATPNCKFQPFWGGQGVWRGGAKGSRYQRGSEGGKSSALRRANESRVLCSSARCQRKVALCYRFGGETDKPMTLHRKRISILVLHARCQSDVIIYRLGGEEWKSRTWLGTTAFVSFGRVEWEKKGSSILCYPRSRSIYKVVDLTSFCQLHLQTSYTISF